MIFDPKPRSWIEKPGKPGNAPIDFRGFKAKPPSNCGKARRAAVLSDAAAAVVAEVERKAVDAAGYGYTSVTYAAGRFFADNTAGLPAVLCERAEFRREIVQEIEERLRKRGVVACRRKCGFFIDIMNIKDCGECAPCKAAERCGECEARTGGDPTPGVTVCEYWDPDGGPVKCECPPGFSLDVDFQHLTF